MVSISSERAPRFVWRNPWAMGSDRVIARWRAIFADGSDSSLARRLAGAAFIIRATSALLAFLSQIIFARWLGGFEFGVYIYAWTWLVLLGGVVDLGLGSAAQSFIPEYTEHKRFTLLRGFLDGSRWLALGLAAAVAVAGSAVIMLLPGVAPQTVAPLGLACAALPALGLATVQSGIARSYDWINLGLMPPFVLRQVVLLALMGATYACGVKMDAVTMMLLTVIAFWTCVLGQLVFINRRLAGVVARGPKTYAPRAWLKTSIPISLIEVIYSLLAYSDIIVLSQFRSPDEVAIYYAAAKSLVLVAFIHFSVAQTVAHKFTEYHVGGDRKRLDDYLAHSLRLTFWPSLGMIVIVLALGKPLLRMFGSGFASGYHLMFIIAIGLLARAAVGPVERLLSMLNERRACAMVYAGTFLLNLVLCILLIPRFGLTGAAVASASALVFESVSLFVVAKYRLGFHCLIFCRPRARA